MLLRTAGSRDNFRIVEVSCSFAPKFVLHVISILTFYRFLYTVSFMCYCYPELD